MNSWKRLAEVEELEQRNAPAPLVVLLLPFAAGRGIQTADAATARNAAPVAQVIISTPDHWHSLPGNGNAGDIG